MPPIDPDTKNAPVNDPEPDRPPVNIDPDDAQIDEPKDDAFEKRDKPANRPAS